MMLFLGILAFMTGGVFWLVAMVALGSFAISGDPIKAVVGIAGIILLLTTTTWVAVTTINHYNAPYITCGASSLQEGS